MRHLGLLRRSVLEAAREKLVSVPAQLDESLLLELVIRTLKNQLRAELRDKHQQRQGEASESVATIGSPALPVFFRRVCWFCAGSACGRRSWPSATRPSSRPRTQLSAT